MISKAKRNDQVIVKNKDITTRLNGIEICLQRNYIYAGLKKFEQNLQVKLSSIHKKEYLIWFHRYRAQWIDIIHNG